MLFIASAYELGSKDFKLNFMKALLIGKIPIEIKLRKPKAIISTLYSLISRSGIEISGCTRLSCNSSMGIVNSWSYRIIWKEHNIAGLVSGSQSSLLSSFIGNHWGYTISSDFENTRWWSFIWITARPKYSSSLKWSISLLLVFLL